MYLSIWNKYLPVIKVILKRAVANEQSLKLDVTDFERAGALRKKNTKFNIETSKGKFVNSIKYPDAAKDFVFTLMHDELAKEILLQNDFSIALSSKYELTVRCITKTDDVESSGDEPAS